MANLVSITKNNSTPANVGKQSLISYLLTDDLSYIMAGVAEDEVIILKEGDVLTNLTKNSGTLTSILKN